jgi:hypothetical protein
VPLFEVEGERPHLVRTPGSGVGSGAHRVVESHIDGLLGEQIFPVAPGAGPDEPHLLALDATGAPVVVELVAELDEAALARALDHAGAAGRMTRAQLAARYHAGPQAFQRDVAEFYDSVPMTRTQPGRGGARLIVICQEARQDVLNAIDFLRQPTMPVEVLRMGVLHGADGRRFIDVSPLVIHPASAPDAPQIVATPGMQPLTAALPAVVPAPGPEAEGAAPEAATADEAAADAETGDAEANDTEADDAETGDAEADVEADDTEAADVEQPAAEDPAPATGPQPVAPAPAPEPAPVPAPVTAPRSATAPEDTAPEDTASEDTAPEAMTPEAVTPAEPRPVTGELPEGLRTASGRPPRVPLRVPLRRSRTDRFAPAASPAEQAEPATTTGATPAPAGEPWSTPPTTPPVPVAEETDPDLIALASSIGADTPLVWSRPRRRQRFEAVLRPDGVIELPDGGRYRHPDVAAVAASGSRSADGWVVWRLGKDTGPTLADAFRDRFA